MCYWVHRLYFSHFSSSKATIAYCCMNQTLEKIILQFTTSQTCILDLFWAKIRVNEEALQFVITLKLALLNFFFFFFFFWGGGGISGLPLLNETLVFEQLYFGRQRERQLIMYSLDIIILCVSYSTYMYLAIFMAHNGTIDYPIGFIVITYHLCSKTMQNLI